MNMEKELKQLALEWNIRADKLLEIRRNCDDFEVKNYLSTQESILRSCAEELLKLVENHA